LTCTRTNETLGARWREIDEAAATWTIPKERTKTAKEHLVPLSDRALAVLKEARRRAKREPTGDGYVFPSHLPRQPLSNMGLLALLRRMGVDATIHGFRSSARSWMADTGVAFEVAEACLAHTVGSAGVQAYQRSSMLERRRPVLQAWSAYVTPPAKAAKVVRLRRARS
jgi:integrase